MKINQVEQQIGITKKNIRFYEEEGLLSPRRNKENGYREYDEEDIKILEQIKLLRKLGLPLEEIRLMQSGRCTVADSMRRHLITLEREERNLAQSVEFCNLLKSEEGILRDMDAGALLGQMEELERSGASFKNNHVGDVKAGHYAASAVIALGITAIMAALIFFFIWTFITIPEDAPPLPIMILFVTIPAVVIIGVVLALIQRIGEIRKGEADDAKKY